MYLLTIPTGSRARVQVSMPCFSTERKCQVSIKYILWFLIKHCSWWQRITLEFSKGAHLLAKLYVHRSVQEGFFKLAILLTFDKQAGREPREKAQSDIYKNGIHLFHCQ